MVRPGGAIPRGSLINERGNGARVRNPQKETAVTNTPRQISVPCIDELLGPADTRFFGSGYRRVRHVIGPSRPLDPAWTRAEATAKVHYPADWSSKAEGTPLPHLSTLDGIMFAAILAARVCRARAVASGRDVPQLTLNSLFIRAGSRPTEELGEVPVSVELLDKEQEPDTATYAARVAGMKAKVSLTPDHTIADQAVPGVDRAGTGYRENTHLIKNVRLDADRVTADVAVSRHGRPAAAGLLDGVVVLAQISQALMYQLDGIDRSLSNTLWMRHVDATVTRPSAPLQDGAWTAGAAIEKAKALRLERQYWRVTSMRGFMAGIDFSYSLAHRL